jgi:hypothetical protein
LEAELSERAHALAEQFEQAVVEFLSVVDGLSDAQWRVQCPTEERSVAVITRHVAFGIHFEMDVFRELAAGRQPATITRADLATMNAAHAVEWADCSKHDTLTHMRNFAAAAAAEVRQLRDAQLARAGKYIDEIPEAWTVDQWIERILIGHVDSHLQDVHAAVALETAL